MFTSTQSRFGAFAVVAASVVSGIASANIILVSEEAVFNSIITSAGGAIDNEYFSGYSGYYGSGLTGGTGEGAWTATAEGGLFALGGIMSTNFSAAPLTLTFSSGNVFAIGGNFFNTDTGFGTVPSLIEVRMNDISYVFNSSSDDFAGFVSTSGAIQAITFTPYGSGEGKFASTDHVVVGAIPSPAALALGALAGLIRRRRR